jgi:HlyD family secretion protein
MKAKKRTWWLAGIAAVVVVGGFLGYRFWKASQTKLPEGIASGNGRLESKLVDIAAKEPLRVKEIFVVEGALVKRGEVLVQLDTTTLDAELAEAEAEIAAAREKLAVSEASIAKQESEIALAQIEERRSQNLAKTGAGSQREVDVRRAKVKTTTAQLGEVQAMLETSREQVAVAEATARTIQTRIDDARLTAPVTGRVLYRLAEPGEVLAAGGKALTLVNLEDVYMEIFLPSEQAATLQVGAEGRIALDFAPRQAIAGTVSFVSPEAQFTPKQVETKSEREKLMFRVKIQVPKETANQYLERLKTGIRGTGYVKLKPDAQWPKWLETAPTPQPQASNP